MEVQKGAGTGENRCVWAEAQGEYSPAEAFLQQRAAEKLQARRIFFKRVTLYLVRSCERFLCLKESQRVQILF